MISCLSGEGGRRYGLWNPAVKNLWSRELGPGGRGHRVGGQVGGEPTRKGTSDSELWILWEREIRKDRAAVQEGMVGVG